MTAGDPAHPDEALVGAILRGEPAAGPDEAAARVPYEALIGQLGALAPIPPASGWEVRMAERVARERRRRLLLFAAIPLAAAAVFLLWFLARGGERATPERPSLAYRIERSGTVVRSETAAIGDVLVMTVDRPEPVVELRVYRDRRSAYRTVASPRSEHRLTFVRAGSYQAVVIAGARPVPDASTGIDGDVATLRAAGFTVELADAIAVR
jgi:hypothetical protein